MFTVGVDGHRVIVGGTASGCAMLSELDAYVGAVTARAHASRQGRDSVAVQNAKMDYVEMVEAAISVVSLAMEELAEQGFVSKDDIPSKPQMQRLDRSLPTYDYIQATYARAVQRIEWIRAVDHILRERRIAVAEPPRDLS